MEFVVENRNRNRNRKIGKTFFNSIFINVHLTNKNSALIMGRKRFEYV